MSSWSTDGADALTPCGHCDNCTRPPEEVQKKDVTVEAWQLLKITDYATQDGANLTLKMLASLARGSGGGGYEVSRGGNGRGGKGKEKEKVNIDLNAIAGGPVNLTQEVCGTFMFLVVSIQVFSFLLFGKETEYLLVDMLVQKYLQESYHQTAYQTLVYLVRGPLGPRLTRLTREALEATKEVNRLVVECTFRKRAGRRRASLKAGSSSQDQQDGVGGKMKKPPGSKRKRDVVSRSEEGDGVVGLSDDEIEEVEMDDQRPRPVPSRSQVPKEISTDDEEESDFIDDGDGWSRSLWPMTKRSLPPTRKKRRSSPGLGGAGGFMGRVITENDKEVMVLSD